MTIFSGTFRSCRPFFGTPGQMLVALREIEHQPSRAFILHPFGMGAKLDRALAQIAGID
jgi:hypothetical protein